MHIVLLFSATLFLLLLLLLLLSCCCCYCFVVVVLVCVFFSFFLGNHPTQGVVSRLYGHDPVFCITYPVHRRTFWASWPGRRGRCRWCTTSGSRWWLGGSCRPWRWAARSRWRRRRIQRPDAACPCWKCSRSAGRTRWRNPPSSLQRKGQKRLSRWVGEWMSG